MPSSMGIHLRFLPTRIELGTSWRAFIDATSNAVISIRRAVAGVGSPMSSPWPDGPAAGLESKAWRRATARSWLGAGGNDFQAAPAAGVGG